MADAEQLKQLSRGVAAWNMWRESHPGVRHPSLGHASLANAILHGANLRRADLEGADLRGADLRRADLFQANLRKADLRQAKLREAKVRQAHLEGADLREAILLRTNFSEAHLEETDLRSANFRQANLSEAHLERAVLEGTILHAATLVETHLEHANLTGAHIYGIAAWNPKLDGAIQSNLVITRENEPVITVDDLEVAQFVYLLLNHQKLRNVLNSVTERGVLILGRFGDGGLAILQSIAARLRELRYLPIIFDFERPDDRNYTETIKTLAGLSRFVIADLSGPSVPQELYATVPHFKIPFAPILEEHRKLFSMAVELFEHPWVLPLFRYSSKEQLISELVTKVIEPAEEKHQARRALLAQVFDRTS